MTTTYSPPGNQPARVRDVTLLTGEKVTHAFSPDDGLVAEAGEEGQLLIATNQRIISFSQDHGHNETVLVPVEERKGVTLRTNARSSVNLFQGLMLAVGGIFAYLVIGYWLSGKLKGPNVPVISIDLGPLVALVAIVWGVALIARYYFSKEDNLVTFRGSNWAFTFPYRGEKAEKEVYQVVNTLFTHRRSRDGHPTFLWDE